MRCDNARKRLSDARGGRPPRRPDALARHLAGCPDCRAYEKDLRLIQIEAARRAPAGRPAGEWTAFERRLEAALDAESGRSPAAAAPRPFARRWAWAGAALLLLALAGGRVRLLRTGGGSEDFVLTFEESLDRISREIGDDERLAGAFNETLLAAIDETLAGADGDLPPELLANPDFLEGLEDAGAGEAARIPPSSL
jgi:hypothetical protein